MRKRSDEENRVLKELEACSLRQMEEIRSLKLELESARKDCSLKDAEISRLQQELRVALEANEELRRLAEEVATLKRDLEHARELLNVRAAEVAWLRELVMHTTAVQSRPQLPAPEPQTAPPPSVASRLRKLIRL
ncbi:MAG: hypothetical protein QHG98_07340 [Methanothrix sp.]|jgi:chromosome segregation ATPase|nr:hypothetical protein [Methanothrix sp.]